jgi:ribosome modulation factor
MKRHKRDKEERAYARGYQIGRSGKSKDLNPYGDTNIRLSWLSGWRQGREDNWNGYVGTAGISSIEL